MSRRPPGPGIYAHELSDDGSVGQQARHASMGAVGSSDHLELRPVASTHFHSHQHKEENEKQLIEMQGRQKAFEDLLVGQAEALYGLLLEHQNQVRMLFYKDLAELYGRERVRGNVLRPRPESVDGPGHTHLQDFTHDGGDGSAHQGDSHQGGGQGFGRGGGQNMQGLVNGTGGTSGQSGNGAFVAAADVAGTGESQPSPFYPARQDKDRRKAPVVSGRYEGLRAGTGDSDVALPGQMDDDLRSEYRNGYSDLQEVGNNDEFWDSWDRKGGRTGKVTNNNGLRNAALAAPPLPALPARLDDGIVEYPQTNYRVGVRTGPTVPHLQKNSELQGKKGVQSVPADKILGVDNSKSRFRRAAECTSNGMFQNGHMEYKTEYDEIDDGSTYYTSNYKPPRPPVHYPPPPPPAGTCSPTPPMLAEQNSSSSSFNMDRSNTMMTILDDEDELSDDPTITKTTTRKRVSRMAQKLDMERQKTGLVAPGDLPQCMFVDEEEMKRRVRCAVTVVEYSVTNYYKDEGWAQWLARNPVFDAMTLFVIAFNALWMSIDTDYNDADTLAEAHPVFQVMEHFVCFYFFLEIVTRFCAFDRKLNCFKDTWFVFDAGLVCMTILETWVMSIVIAATNIAEDGNLKTASVVRLARLMRIARMARLIRLIRAIPELMILIKGMLMAARSVFLTMFLLAIVIYVWGMALTQLCQGSEVGKLYWSSVPHSMKTLLLHGCFLEDLPDVVNASGIYVGGFVLMFVLLASMTIMNMLVGVLVEVVSTVASVEKETIQVNFVKQKLQSTLEELDENQDGMISRHEFNMLLAMPESARALQDVGVDVVGLVDFADVIFDDQESLTFANFMEMVLQLRGSNMATVKDIVDLRKCLLQELYKALIKTEQRMEHSRSVAEARLRDELQESTPSSLQIVRY
eukprot:TRINITY_DN9276_c0_g5_i1.p1 TRINITY_DN9276_c0_g5~~TRINITY_DN9276_c0_g5_i1.p1  ORF type:complete len:911 (+),score=225.90 TRINITY_DN9276_c0_g5_i1:113-2845(+)